MRHAAAPLPAAIASSFSPTLRWPWALPEAKQLRELLLYECEVTDDGATELLEALASEGCGIETLDLRGNLLLQCNFILAESPQLRHKDLILLGLAC